MSVIKRLRERNCVYDDADALLAFFRAFEEVRVSAPPAVSRALLDALRPLVVDETADPLGPKGRLIFPRPTPRD